ncbi:MAG TPA: hypothetical protein VFB60_18330 [Ktedonobacteraceae bacterium]|nr:hypothetical protein [Ktedonobacteraceae bacterium]
MVPSSQYLAHLDMQDTSILIHLVVAGAVEAEAASRVFRNASVIVLAVCDSYRL